jgi:hypothetical protein
MARSAFRDTRDGNGIDCSRAVQQFSSYVIGQLATVRAFGCESGFGIDFYNPLSTVTQRAMIDVNNNTPSGAKLGTAAGATFPR